MGVSETTVSSMRRAGTEPRAGDAVKIARELGTTVEYLATGVASEVGDNYREKYFELKEKIIKLGNTG
jgi:transcriptional regulator with XRE-family HTH domain